VIYNGLDRSGTATVLIYSEVIAKLKRPTPRFSSPVKAPTRLPEKQTHEIEAGS
jgi:hypothetical protein